MNNHDLSAEMDSAPRVLSALRELESHQARMLALEGDYLDAQRTESRARQSRLNGRKVSDSAIATATASTLDLQHDLKACQDALDSARLTLAHARQEWIESQVVAVSGDLSKVNEAEQSRIDAVGEALAVLYRAMASDGVSVREDVSGDPYGALNLAMTTLSRRLNRYSTGFGRQLGDVAGLSAPHMSSIEERRKLDERLNLLTKMRATERTPS